MHQLDLICKQNKIWKNLHTDDRMCPLNTFVVTYNFLLPGATRTYWWQRWYWKYRWNGEWITAFTGVGLRVLESFDYSFYFILFYLVYSLQLVLVLRFHMICLPSSGWKIQKLLTTLAQYWWKWWMLRCAVQDNCCCSSSYLWKGCLYWNLWKTVGNLWKWVSLSEKCEKLCNEVFIRRRKPPTNLSNKFLYKIVMSAG